MRYCIIQISERKETGTPSYLSRPQGSVYALVSAHRHFLFRGNIVVAIQLSLFVAWELVFLRMVASHAIDVPRKRGIVGSNKGSTSGGNPLIQHAKVVCIDTIQQVLEVAEKVNVVLPP